MERRFELNNTPIEQKKMRNEGFDTMRGIAMICVILIHMGTQAYLGYGIAMLMYYAVPTYFFISGYLLSASASRSQFSSYLLKRVKGLLVPYVCFFAISLLWTQTVYAYFLHVPLFSFSVDWMAMLRAFAFSGKDLFQIALVHPPLWFLHALFFVSLAFYFLAKIKKLWITALLAFVLLTISVPIQRLPISSDYWIISLFPAALFFMVCGKLVRQLNDGYVQFKEKIKYQAKLSDYTGLLSAFLVPLLILFSLLLMQDGRGDIWHISSEWYFLGAMVFTAACYLISQQSKNALLLFAGKHSLLYLGLHSLALSLPFIAGLPETFQNMGFDRTASFVCYFIVALMLTSAMVFLCVSTKNLFMKVINKSKNTEVDIHG